VDAAGQGGARVEAAKMLGQLVDLARRFLHHEQLGLFAAGEFDNVMQACATQTPQVPTDYLHPANDYALQCCTASSMN
jgi:hypothetical protein